MEKLATDGVPRIVAKSVRLEELIIVGPCVPLISLKLTLLVVFVIAVIARLMSVPDHVVGVNEPQVNAGPGVVVEPLSGCRYTRMWLDEVCSVPV